uniref:ZP domain-containing protein n=1 Tax=Rhabditophanes sp. KR3021 TaxID=114890 RepID=A0AC35TGB1_9BILA
MKLTTLSTLCLLFFHPGIRGGDDEQVREMKVNDISESVFQTPSTLLINHCKKEYLDSVHNEFYIINEEFGNEPENTADFSELLNKVQKSSIAISSANILSCSQDTSVLIVSTSLKENITIAVKANFIKADNTKAYAINHGGSFHYKDSFHGMQIKNNATTLKHLNKRESFSPVYVFRINLATLKFKTVSEYEYRNDLAFDSYKDESTLSQKKIEHQNMPGSTSNFVRGDSMSTHITKIFFVSNEQVIKMPSPEPGVYYQESITLSMKDVLPKGDGHLEKIMVSGIEYKYTDDPDLHIEYSVRHDTVSFSIRKSNLDDCAVEFHFDFDRLHFSILYKYLVEMKGVKLVTKEMYESHFKEPSFNITGLVVLSETKDLLNAVYSKFNKNPLTLTCACNEIEDEVYINNYPCTKLTITSNSLSTPTPIVKESKLGAGVTTLTFQHSLYRDIDVMSGDFECIATYTKNGENVKAGPKEFTMKSKISLYADSLSITMQQQLNATEGQRFEFSCNLPETKYDFFFVSVNFVKEGTTDVVKLYEANGVLGGGGNGFSIEDGVVNMSINVYKKKMEMSDGGAYSCLYEQDGLPGIPIHTFKTISFVSVIGVLSVPIAPSNASSDIEPCGNDVTTLPDNASDNNDLHSETNQNKDPQSVTNDSSNPADKKRGDANQNSEDNVTTKIVVIVVVLALICVILLIVCLVRRKKEIQVMDAPNKRLTKKAVNKKSLNKNRNRNSSAKSQVKTSPVKSQVKSSKAKIQSKKDSSSESDYFGMKRLKI